MNPERIYYRNFYLQVKENNNKNYLYRAVFFTWKTVLWRWYAPITKDKMFGLEERGPQIWSHDFTLQVWKVWLHSKKQTNKKEPYRSYSNRISEKIVGKYLSSMSLKQGTIFKTNTFCKPATQGGEKEKKNK